MRGGRVTDIHEDTTAGMRAAQPETTRINEAVGLAVAKPTGGTQRFGTPTLDGIQTADVLQAEVRATGDETAETVGQGATNEASGRVRRRASQLRVKSNTQTRRGAPRPYQLIETESRPRKVNEGRERTPSHTEIQAATEGDTLEGDALLLGNQWGRIPTAHRMSTGPAPNAELRPLLPFTWPLIGFLASAAAIGAIYYVLLNG